MAEVLSQSQIDALLNAVRSGEKDPEKTEEEKPEKKFRKYDFKNPRKFAKDRIKMLNGIFENYSRVITSRLNALLRINCVVSVESIEEQRYYEFSNALTEGDVLSMVDVTVKDKTDEAQGMFYMSTSTTLMMVDRMMGGGGGGLSEEDDISSDYTYTDLELRLYEKLVEDLVELLGSSWENYLAVDFTYSRTEVNPTLVQLIGLDEIVIIADMKVEMEGGDGRISLCLPSTMLTNLFSEINRENPGRKVSGEDKSEEIFDKLRGSTLDVVAQLGKTQLTLSDIYHLNIGDVLDLGRSKDSPIFLQIGGYQWFTGRIGKHKKNLAVKIDEVCYQADRRSE